MAEHRERVDKRMSQEMNRRAIIPLSLCLGARYLKKPYLGKYDDDEKTVIWGLGHKRHGDKRHRSAVTYEGIHYADGDRDEGRTRPDCHGSSGCLEPGKHDNRLAQNDETFGLKKLTYDESFTRVRSFSSFDLLNRFSGSAQATIIGIGGSASSTTETHVHTELEAEKFNQTKSERVIDTSSHLYYPGPLYRTDLDENGVVIGRTLVEEGPIWLIECPIETVHTITPITEWGVWDSRHHPEHRGLGRQLLRHAQRGA